MIETKDLNVYYYSQKYNPLFDSQKNVIKAVDFVNLKIKKGEILGLVGESGSGKSTLGKTILQLQQPTSGSVYYNDIDLCKLDQKSLKSIRKKLQIIFQDPYASLDPRKTIDFTVTEPLLVHDLLTKKKLKSKAEELLNTVGLDPSYCERYPHELSGGQRQRVGIARALSTEPEFIVADEPVSALDVSIQGQILSLIKKLQKDLNLTILFISHDLRVVRYLSNRIAVMLNGKIVDFSQDNDIFKNQSHPYTRKLLASIPVASWER